MITQIQKHTGTLRYNHKQITFHFWSHTDGTTPVDTVIFLGSAQVGRIPKWVAEAAPAGVVVVDGLPHWEAHPSASDLGTLAHQYTMAAFKAVLECFKIPSATIVGVSQAGPGVVWTAHSLPNEVQHLALVAPLGLTAKILGPTPQDRLKKLKKRTFHTSLQSFQTILHDLRPMYAQLMLMEALLREKRWDAAGNKYSAGLSYDLLDDCRVVVQERRRRGYSFMVFLGEKDKIFPPHEVLASLEQAKIDHAHTITLPGINHPFLAGRGDAKIVRQIISTLRSGVTAKHA